MGPIGVTEAFVALVVVTFFILVFLGSIWLVANRDGACAGATRDDLGILGTFIGIVLGLRDFDPERLDESIEVLLEGLKTAFYSSIAGISASILFRFVEPFLGEEDRRSD